MSGGGQQRIRGLLYASAGPQWSLQIFPISFPPYISRATISLTLVPHQSSADSLPPTLGKVHIPWSGTCSGPGIPRFIARHFIAPHRGCFSYKLKARPSTSKNITTCFSVLLTLLRWSGIDPQYFQGVTVAFRGHI